jgi:putative redox protein
MTGEESAPVKITVRPAGGAKLDVNVDGLTIKTDLPVEKGGENTAPGPYRLFLSSIAAGIYAVNFCRQRNLPTEGLEVVQTWEHNESGSRLEKVRLEVNLPPGFPEKYRRAILKAVELCPVKRALADGPEVTVTLNAS